MGPQKNQQNLYEKCKTVEEVIELCRNDAKKMAKILSATPLKTCIGNDVAQHFGSGTILALLDNIHADMGRPKDPIANFMIEQLTWAHYRLSHLLCQATSAQKPELIKEYDAAAVRLMAEIRKMALALREYRTPITPKQVMVVQQQNVASGDQQVAYVAGKTAPEKTEKNASDTELASNPKESLAYEPSHKLDPQPKEGSCRKAELVETRATDARRQRTPATSCATELPLDILDRPKDGRRQSTSGVEREDAPEGQLVR